MTEQTIPADQVRELIKAYETGERNSLLDDLRALIHIQPQPTTGLFGRWAKHDFYGDVLITSDRVNQQGNLYLSWKDGGGPDGAGVGVAKPDSLTFPEQATRPEDVELGQPWIVNVDAPHCTVSNAVGFRHTDDDWLIVHSNGTNYDDCYYKNVTLISPLVPARPTDDGRDYKTEYWEAQAQIDKYEAERQPKTVTTQAEYAALPAGSVVAHDKHYAFTKSVGGYWHESSHSFGHTNFYISRTTRTVLREGWGE